MGQSFVFFGMYCNCIGTRVGVYNEILPGPDGNPEAGAKEILEGVGDILLYSPTRVKIRSFSITS